MTEPTKQEAFCIFCGTNMDTGGVLPFCPRCVEYASEPVFNAQYYTGRAFGVRPLMHSALLLARFWEAYKEWNISEGVEHNTNCPRRLGTGPTCECGAEKLHEIQQEIKNEEQKKAKEGRHPGENFCPHPMLPHDKIAPAT